MNQLVWGIMEMISVCWLRRDLRLDDNAALYYALKAGFPVLPLFIFDTDIIQHLPRNDARVEFIHQALGKMNQVLIQLGSALEVRIGQPKTVWEKLLSDYNVQSVYTNHDYEPYAEKRDEEIVKLLTSKGIPFKTYKDQVIFEKEEVLKDDGSPFVVYTPYSKRWKAKLNDFYLKSYPTEKYFHNFLKRETRPIPSLKEIGFEPSSIDFPPIEPSESLLRDYHKTRDLPGIDGTSKMGVHLRFGTISIRKLAVRAKELNEKYLNELIWREFYQAILWHFPHVVQSAFRKEYDSIKWRNDEKEFQRWCEGRTGVPIVDAGIRELNTTGYMHNRVRMIAASYLVKDLLIDWRWGEAYFAEKLLDFDLASNNGSWQWVAGSGVDAAPYFRVFNPYLQAKKFDPELKYIRKWVPELESLDYPAPIIEHEHARERTLKAYKTALDYNKAS
ncbi:MAG: deoxyribodipyrimidine photo-lyase [Chitinophagales bacterium]|nr:deoxyribodipyrimidine photo-lyase [Chitinophagales bacterium]